MARRISEESLQAVEEVVGRRPEGMTARQIADALGAELPFRTLQYRLKALVDDKRLIRNGSGRWARYRLPKVVPLSVRFSGSVVGSKLSVRLTVVPALSEPGAEIRNYVRQPSNGT